MPTNEKEINCNLFDQLSIIERKLYQKLPLVSE